MVDTLRAFVLVGGVFSGGLLLGAGTVRTAWGAGDVYAGLDTFARALTTIQGAYVEEHSPTELIHAAIRGMVGDLDPYSVWLAPDEYQKLQERADGRYFGIGVELVQGEAGVRIERVLPRGPAEIAGMLPGDVLTAVDGKPLGQLSLDAVRDLLTGPRGESVIVDLRRKQAPLSLTIVRDEILDVSVDSELLEPGLGYVRVQRFSRRTATETALAIQQLSREAPLIGLVLDLRDNPGGLITEAVEMVDLFVPEGPIVETRGRGGAPEVYTATTDAADFTVPLAVLINQDSASASELVAGALQDLERATLIGTRSYGKGSMQSVYEFGDGSALKLTVARYYLPSGRAIAPREGLDPDTLVPMKASPRQQASSLHEEIEALDLPEEKTRSLLATLDALPLADAPARSASIPWSGDLAERMAHDPQLNAAFDHLRAQKR